MNSVASSSLADFVVTREYQRFVEFCEACRQYHYIGLCYGPPGVGKTLSALYYTKWDKIEAFRPYGQSSAAALREVLLSNTVFSPVPVVISPKELARDVMAARDKLHAIRMEPLRREEARERGKLQKRQQKRLDRNWYDSPLKPLKPSYADITRLYQNKHSETPDPTSLVIIDETDRLKMAGLEQVRDLFDQGGIGPVLIGMPGMEKRLARYAQLYSRVGFVHAFRPLRAEDIRQLLQERWAPAGVSLPKEGIVEEEAAVAALIRISEGNFRLLHRLLTQVARLMEINALKKVTSQVVEAARESLVIGTT